MNKQLLTRKEYADYRKENNLKGCTYQTVCQKISKGQISLIDGKLIDPEIADEEWRRNTRIESYPIDDQASQDVQCSGVDDVPAYTESKARIEAIKAIKEQLSLDEMQGELVRVSDVYEQVFDIIGTLKQSLMLIPQRVAPEVTSLTDITDVENAIDAEITATLEQLSVQLSRSEVLNNAGH